MKNLKKIFALVLVIAMAFSMMVVASAAAPSISKYSDAASITQKEAVDLLSAIGVLGGSDGKFSPTDTVTREQAAKVIAYLLLGSSATDSLKTTTTSFSDVAASRWSAGAIQYCVSKNIINGRGDGTFDPEGAVTGSAFAKLLLTALGYGKNGEYTGANWEINAIADGQRLGILSLNVNMTEPATREQVAQYAFNAYTRGECFTVAFSKDTESYVANSTHQNAGTTVLETLSYQQKVWKADFKMVDGFTTYIWQKNYVTLATDRYADSDEVVLATNTAGAGTTNLTTIGHPKYVASLDNDLQDIEVYINGARVPGDEATVLAAANTATATKWGVIVKLVDTDSNGGVDRIVILRKNVATVGGAVTTTSSTTTVPGVCANQASSLITGAAGLVKDDVVLYWTDTLGVIHIEKCKSVTGQATSGSASMLVVGSGFHFQSSLPGTTADFAAFIADSNNFGKDLTIYLDDNNDIVKIVKADTSDSTLYGVITAYNYNSIAGSAVVRITKSDGTTAGYTVAADASGNVPNQTTAFAGATIGADGAFTAGVTGFLATYSLDTNGKISFVVTGTTAALADDYDAKGVSVTTAANTYYITDTTKVFYFDSTGAYHATTNKVAATIGYGQTKEVLTGVNATYVLKTGTNIVTAIMFAQEETVATSENFAYLIWPFYFNGPTTSYIGATPYYTYNVYVDGKATTLKSASNTMFQVGGLHQPGLYAYTIGANDYVISTSAVDARILTVNADTTAVGTGYVAWAGGSIITNSSTKFMLINADPDLFPVGGISEGSIGLSVGDVHYTISSIVRNAVNATIADVVYYTYSVGP